MEAILVMAGAIVFACVIVLSAHPSLQGPGRRERL